MLNILETEDERLAREMELRRAGFALGIGGAQAPTWSDKPTPQQAPPDPNRTSALGPSGPAKTPAAGDAVYGSSPAAMKFRQQTAQIAPSAPMATGFEKNPVAFNNSLNAPQRSAPKAPALDIIAAPSPGEAPLALTDPRDDPAAAQPPAKKGTEDIVGPPARNQTERQRQIEGLRQELATWKTSFWDKSKFSNRQAEYQNKIRALDQLEQAEAAEQLVKREDRSYQLDLDKFNYEKGKPVTVGRDSHLAVPKSGGAGYDFLSPPEPPAKQKPLDPGTPQRDSEGYLQYPVWDPNVGEFIFKKSPFKTPAPKDPADAEAVRIDREGRAETRKKEAETREDEKRRKLLYEKQAFDIDKDNKAFPTLGRKRQAKREAATALGLPDPFDPQAAATPARVDLGGAKKKPEAASGGGGEKVDAVVTRDANGRLVMGPGR